MLSTKEVGRRISALPDWQHPASLRQRMELCLDMMRLAVTSGYSRHQFNMVITACTPDDSTADRETESHG